MLKDKIVLVTGGTGSFGKKFIRTILDKHRPKKVIVFSRDEFKQSEMAKDFDYPNLRFFVGDVRDKDRLVRAFKDVDYVVHAAALKQVPAMEYNPCEAVKTNVMGASNIIDAALDTGVQKVTALSTDKAVNPINLYGATKMCAEKLFKAANSYKGALFNCVRYGNVIGSRGSVIPYFQKLAKTVRPIEVVPITDPQMTRFWLTLDQAVNLVLFALRYDGGGVTFVPDIPAASMLTVCKAICPDNPWDMVGMRPGEKMHETLMNTEEKGVWMVAGGVAYGWTPTVDLRSDNVHQMDVEEMRCLISTAESE